jgi:hypothetical protein
VQPSLHPRAVGSRTRVGRASITCLVDDSGQLYPAADLTTRAGERCLLHTCRTCRRARYHARSPASSRRCGAGANAARWTADTIDPAAYVIDDSGVPKEGVAPPCASRQHSGALGKTGNCQIGSVSSSHRAGRPWTSPSTSPCPACGRTEIKPSRQLEHLHERSRVRLVGQPHFGDFGW